MNEKLQEALQRASQLTRAGRLADATAAIQQALGRGARPPPATPRPSDADIIDVEARVVGERAPESERPAPPNEEAPGAADDPSPGSFSTGRFRNQAGQRDYKLFRPHATPEDGRPPALVVMLHGCTQDPDDFAAGTRMNPLADTRGWWVLYPAQSARANGSGCWNWFKPADQQRGGGEPEILAGMTSDIVARHGLDRSRVFVAGLSAGGAMAVTLAATHPELVAAVGVHSGLPHGGAHDLMSALTAMRQGAAAHAPPHRVRTIVFHGDQDHTVHPCNGHAVARQARADPTPPGARDDGPTETERARVPGGHAYTRTLHRDADGRVDAEHWLIHGAGHAWSGGSPAGTYTDPRGPDASAEMLRFFADC